MANGRRHGVVVVVVCVVVVVVVVVIVVVVCVVVGQRLASSRQSAVGSRQKKPVKPIENGNFIKIEKSKKVVKKTKILQRIDRSIDPLTDCPAPPTHTDHHSIFSLTLCIYLYCTSLNRPMIISTLKNVYHYCTSPQLTPTPYGSPSLLQFGIAAVLNHSIPISGHIHIWHMP